LAGQTPAGPARQGHGLATTGGALINGHRWAGVLPGPIARRVALGP
jgi:hypothetical protein